MLQINVEALRNTDHGVLQKLHNDGVAAATLMGSEAYPWFEEQLEQRSRALTKVLVSGDDTINRDEVAGRLRELLYIRDSLIAERVAAYRRFQQALKEHLQTDDEEAGVAS